MFVYFYCTYTRPLKRYLCQWGFTPDRSDELGLQQVTTARIQCRGLWLMFYTGRRSASSRRISGRLDEGIETERFTGETEGRGTAAKLTL